MTLTTFEKFVGPGTETTMRPLPHLTAEEQSLLSYLTAHNLRLEQERISQDYVVESLQDFLTDPN